MREAPLTSNSGESAGSVYSCRDIILDKRATRFKDNLPQ